MSFQYFCVASCNDNAIFVFFQFNMLWKFGFPLKLKKDVEKPCNLLKNVLLLWLPILKRA